MALRRLGLGIDAGGSATRWALCDTTGAVTGAGELPAVSGHLFNATERARLEHMAALLRAQVGAADIGVVVAGITGIAAATEEAALAASALATALGIDEARVQVDDDMWIAYHAAFRPGEGHLVYAGTGSIGVHVRADGSVVRVGGRGMLIDDGGSAFWIGRQALKLVWRRIDQDPERGGQGPLASEISAAIGDASWDAARTYVYSGGRSAVAALAQAVARALVRRAGTRPVALAGRAAALHPAILEGFRAALPELEFQLISIDAARTAARLAVEACRAAAQGAG